MYWSRPQVQARQAVEMATTKRWMNRLWDADAPAGPEFDVDEDYAYADRTRRRAPGDSTLGLSPHMDAGSYERWVDPAFRRIYAPLFAGAFDAYDPWRGAYRTQTREYESPAVSSMFRTFQGWTALTEQGPGDGTLELVPIADAIGHVLLRALQDDVPGDELPLAKPGRALGVDERWHPELIGALVPIQTVEPGDTVWWHPDVVHAVGAEHRGGRVRERHLHRVLAALPEERDLRAAPGRGLPVGQERAGLRTGGPRGGLRGPGDARGPDGARPGTDGAELNLG